MHHYKGILYSLNLNDPEAKPTPLAYENFDDSEFVPHGIDFYMDPKTQDVRLFVVNHAAGNHSIEIFQFDHVNMVLKHRKTVVDEKIYSPNDVVAVGMCETEYFTINSLQLHVQKTMVDSLLTSPSSLALSSSFVLSTPSPLVSYLPFSPPLPFSLLYYQVF